MKVLKPEDSPFFIPVNSVNAIQVTRVDGVSFYAEKKNNVEPLFLLKK